MKLLVEHLALYICIFGSNIPNCLTGDGIRQRDFANGVANAATIRESYKETSNGCCAWGGPFFPLMDLTKEDYIQLYERRLNNFSLKLGYSVDFGNICQQLRIADTLTWIRDLESLEEVDARRSYFFGPLVETNLVNLLTEEQRLALDEMSSMSPEELQDNGIVDISLPLDEGVSMSAFEIIVQLLELRGATYEVAHFLRGISPKFQGLVVGLMNTSNFELDVEVLENFFVAIDRIRFSYLSYSVTDIVNEINVMATKYPAVFAYRDFSHRVISNDAEEYAFQQLCWVVNVKYSKKIKILLQDITSSYRKSFGLHTIDKPLYHDSFKYAFDMSNIIKKANKSTIPDDIKVLTQRVEILRQYGVSNEPGKRICIQNDSTIITFLQIPKPNIPSTPRRSFKEFTETMNFSFPLVDSQEIFRSNHMEQTISNFVSPLVNIS